MTRLTILLPWVFFGGALGPSANVQAPSKPGSEMSNDVAVAMAVAPNGDVFVTGYSKVGPSGYDYETIKYNANGDLNGARGMTEPQAETTAPPP